MTSERKPNPGDPLITIANIQGVFNNLAELSTMNLKPQVRDEARRLFARHLLYVLPPHVTALDLGDGTQITRGTETISPIPMEERETWGLPEVDEYAVLLAKGAKQKWEPRFLKK